MSTPLLAGRVAVVTGAARGLGRAIAQRFCEEGAAVALADLDGDGAGAAARELAGGGARAGGYAVDVTDADSLSQLRERVESELGAVDVVVANAGIFTAAPAIDIPERTWRRVLDVNLTGALLTVQAFVVPMVDRGASGSVVLTSSLFGTRGGVGNAAYSASKFGVIGLMQCLAAELGPVGITVNAVCPGQIETEMLRGLLDERAAAEGRPREAVERELTERVALGRMGSSEEVADTFVFLASPLSRYVTGESIIIDGGWRVG